MNQPEINIKLPVLKFSLDAITIKAIQLPKFNISTLEARINFHKQSPANKLLSPYRFWEKPKTLKERYLQFIAAQELEKGKNCDRNELIDDLNEAIDEKLAQANEKLFLEKMMADINKENLSFVRAIESFTQRP